MLLMILVNYKETNVKNTNFGLFVPQGAHNMGTMSPSRPPLEVACNACGH